jgi:hypothetical protein
MFVNDTKLRTNLRVGNINISTTLVRLNCLKTSNVFICVKTVGNYQKYVTNNIILAGNLEDLLRQ